MMMMMMMMIKWRMILAVVNAIYAITWEAWKKIRTYFIYVEQNKKSNNLILISKANYKILCTVKLRLKNYMSESTVYNSFRLKKSTLFGFKKFSLVKKCYSNKKNFNSIKEKNHLEFF